MYFFVSDVHSVRIFALASESMCCMWTCGVCAVWCVCAHMVFGVGARECLHVRVRAHPCVCLLTRACACARITIVGVRKVCRVVARMIQVSGAYGEYAEST